MIGLPVLAAAAVPAVLLLLRRGRGKKERKNAVQSGTGTGAREVEATSRANEQIVAAEGAAESQKLPEALGRKVEASAAPQVARVAAQRTPTAESSQRVPLLELRVLTGKHAGDIFCKPNRDTVRVGRFAGNAVCITDNEVSSQHAELKWSREKGCWLLMDLGSLNGTWLNGVRISKEGRAKGDWHTVRDSDTIAFGERDVSPKVRVALLEEAGVPAHALRPQLAYAVAEEAGKGHPSEDRVLCECPLRDFPTAGLFAVLDGHCGAVAAERAQAIVSQEVCKALKAHAKDVERGDASAALRAAVAALDEQITDEYEGCAATLVLVWRAARPPEQPAAPSGAPSPMSSPPWPHNSNGDPTPELFVQAANVGDCSAVLAEGGARDGAGPDDEGPPSVRTTATGEGEWLNTPDGGGAAGGGSGSQAAGLRRPSSAASGAPPAKRVSGSHGGYGVAAALLAASTSGSTSGRSVTSTVGAGNSGVGLGVGGFGGGGGRGSVGGGGGGRPPWRARSTSVLTFDHKVKAPEESKRIQEAGFPIQEGDGRVYGLALSRTLGDRFLKSETQSAIIAEPHVSAPHRAPPGAILVVGSDGLWDVVSPQKAVEIAGAVREELGGMRKECAEALLRHARANRSRDDCSVVVVDLDAHALGLHLLSEVPTLRVDPGVSGRGGGGAGGDGDLRLSMSGLGSPVAAGTTPTAAALAAAWSAAEGAAAAQQQPPLPGEAGAGEEEPTTPTTQPGAAGGGGS